MKTSRALFFVAALILVVTLKLSAQNGVAVNTTGAPADLSAIFDASSTTKGILVPRMDNAQRDAIVNPAEGLLIFNITTKCFNFFKNGYWWELCGDCLGSQPPLISNNGPICAGDTLKLTASFIAGASYTWTGPNGFASAMQNPYIANATTAASGTYSVITVVAGCTSTPATTVAVVNAVPSSSFTFLPVAPTPGTNVTFTPSVVGATYNWIFQGGTPGTSTAQNPVVQWASIGTYDVTLTVSMNGCSSSTSVQVTVSNYTPGSQTFNYTGSSQTFTVPTGVTSVTIQAYGAQGGDGSAGYGQGYGGLGGLATGTLAVTPGQVLQINVGGAGVQNGAGGFNGGGQSGQQYGASGGGASDVRAGAYTLNDRVIVGGGGGGCSFGSYPQTGGTGGGLTGGQGGSAGGYTGGGGGTQVAGGAAGCCYGAAAPGSFGVGAGPGDYHNAGGGGGWYGGGSGAGHGAAGGGSSYLGGLTGSSTTAGVRSGNGQVIVTW